MTLKVFLAPTLRLAESGVMTRRTTSAAGGTTTTTEVSECLHPFPRPTTLKVPTMGDENTPSALMLPPLAPQTTGIEIKSPRRFRDRPRKRTRWWVSMVTERGETFREIGWSEALPDGSASGAVVSP